MPGRPHYLRFANNCTAPTEAFKTSADRDDSLPKLEPETRHGKHILPGDSTQKDKTEETQKLHTNKPSAKTQCCIAIKKVFTLEFQRERGNVLHIIAESCTQA